MKDAELMPKRLDLLLELVPKGQVFALVVNPKAAFTPAVIHIAQQAAHAKGIELYVLQARTDVEIDAAFSALGQLKPDGVIFEGDKLFDSRAVDGKLVTMAAHAAVPAVYAWDLIAWSGGLVTYGADRDLARRQMGRYVARILQGSKPADMPFVQAQKIDLCINTKTARALGISVPQSLLRKADQVIA